MENTNMQTNNQNQEDITEAKGSNEENKYQIINNSKELIVLIEEARN